MTVRRHALSFLLVVIALAIGASTYVSSTLFSGFTDEIEQSQFELMQATLEARVRATEGRAAARAALIADIPEVRRLFAARDRDGLLAELRGVWTTQHDQFGAAVMQFHTAPGISFLRVHRPDQFGDDLTSYRPLVVAVMNDHAPHQGAAISRTGVGIVAIVPVLDPSGAFTGSFEVGMDVAPMLDDLDQSFGLSATLFALEAELRETATSMDASLLDEAHRVGSYTTLASTNAALAHQLVRAADLAHVDDATHYTREADGVTYGVLLSPVRTASGDQFGVLAVARDFSATRAATGRSRVWQALVALFAIVTLWGAALIVVRGMVLSPVLSITERFADLVRGDRDRAIERTEKLPAEIQALAAQHEALRTKGIGVKEGE
jgi:hypothetical protein